MKIKNIIVEFAEKPEDGPGSDDYEDLLFHLAYEIWEDDGEADQAKRKLSLLGWKPKPGDDYTAIVLYKIGGNDHRQYKIDDFEEYGQQGLNEFAPGGNSASSYYAVTSNFVNEFAQQQQEELQDLIDSGWTEQDLAQSGHEQDAVADMAYFEQVRDSFLKGLKPGFDAYLQGDTMFKDQLGAYWIENDLPLNQDWKKIYGEEWGDDGEEDEFDKEEGNMPLTPAVDAKGRTQQQWIQAVKAKFPDAQIIQTYLMDGPLQANLSDGRRLNWIKVEQGVAKGDLDERNMGQPRVAAAKPEIISAVDNGKTITVQVRVPDGTTRSMSNSNPALIQQWLNVKYGLRFPANIARKFVGMPASMAEGEVTKTTTGLRHRATDKYGAGDDEPHHYTGGRSGFSDPGKYARDLEHVNKQLVKDLDASMGISWKNRGTKGVEVDEQGVAEATGDEKFDTMMGQIQREPKYPDSQMPPTDVKDLYQWAVKNNKPYHKIFAEWANREGYKSVAPALQRAGDLDTEALDYWTPRVWKIYWGEVRGIDSEMPPEWSKKRVPDELRDYLETVFDAYDRIVFDWPTEYRQIGGQDNYAEGDLNEKSTSQAQFRTMAAAAHNPAFARKVGIDTDVAQEFHGADRGQDYKSLPKKANEAAPVAPNPQNYDSDWDYYNDRDAEEPEDTDADYENMIDEPSDDWFDESKEKVGNMDADAFDDAIARMKKLAGAGPLKTVYDPARRVYKNVPTAQQPAKQPQK